MRPPTALVERGRRRWLWLGAAALLAGGVAAAWWWHRSAVAPVDPPLPVGLEDAEVRHAIERARGQVLDNPRSADAWGRLGMTLWVHLFDRDADRCFAEAVRLGPLDARWPFARAQIARKHDLDAALSFFRQAVTAAAHSSPRQLSEIRLSLAEALVEHGELDEAEKLFQEERDRDPNGPRAAFGLGLIAVQRGDSRSAAALLTEARRSKLVRKRATVQLAVLARRGGDSAAARYEKEAAVLPDDPPWPDSFLENVRQLRVGQSRIQRDADGLASRHRYAEAAKLWLEQLRQRRTCQTCTAAGLNLARLGDYDCALPLLHEALDLDPTSAQAHYTLALTLFLRAEQEWQPSPGSASAKEWFRDSIIHAHRAAQEKADYAHAYLIWGAAHNYLGEPAAAIPPLRQGVACQPDSLELQLALGEALLTAGQGAEAKKHLENARRLDANDPRLPGLLERLHKKRP